MKPTFQTIELDRQVIRGQVRRPAAPSTSAIDRQVVRGHLPPQAVDALQRVVARVPSKAAQTIDRQVLLGVSGLGDNGDFGGETGPAIDPSTGLPISFPNTSSINWGSILNTAVSGGLNILKMEATPQGYFQTGPGGTVYRAPDGSVGFPGIPAFGSGTGGSGTLLLLGGLALVLVLVAGRR